MEISQKVLVDMHSTLYESLNVSASNKNKSGFRILESILKDYCNRKNASISDISKHLKIKQKMAFILQSKEE